MFRLKQFYNQNRKKIWTCVLLIIFLFGILKLLDYIAQNKSNTKDISNSSTNSTTITATTDEREKQTVSVNDYIISENIANANEKIINSFVKYCNNGETSKAYELLSSNCKEVMYSTEKDFVDNYCRAIFTEKRICDLQSWLVDESNYTYKITLGTDILSTGQVNNSNQKTDYITVIEENNEKKLNINSYVGRKNVKGTDTSNDVQVTVNYKDVYIEYEEYNITVKNKSENIIMLDSKADGKTIYLLDDNEVKYSAYTHEIDKIQLIFKSQQKRVMNIKFNKTYETEKSIKNIYFTDVIIDYKEYVQDKENYKDKEEIIISL